MRDIILIDYYDAKERAAVSSMKHAFQALKVALLANNRLVAKYPVIEEVPTLIFFSSKLKGVYI